MTATINSGMKELSPDRDKLEGLKRVVQFNWPIYGVAVGVLLITSFTSLSKSSFVRILSRLVTIATALQTISSLVASCWVYDLSKLHRWHWLKEYLPPNPVKALINIHSGYDETNGAIAPCFPEAEYSVIDLYPALKRIEPSIEKARRLYPPSIPPVSQSLTHWPFRHGSIDLIVMPFAAHELRGREEKVALFKQVEKMLRPETGRAILVEHLRNAANAIAYGPAYFHFFSENEWLECISQAGLKVIERDTLTPLIGVLVICRKD